MTSTTRSSRRGVYAALFAAMITAAPAALLAQAPAPDNGMGQPPAGGPGMRGPGGMGARMLMEGITLTDAQRVRVDSINRAYGERMRARREMTQGGPGAAAGQDAPRPDSASRAVRYQQMQREMTDRNTAIRAVLTGDQQKTFDANLARMDQMRQQRMRDGGGMGPGGRARN